MDSAKGANIPYFPGEDTEQDCQKVHEGTVSKSSVKHAHPTSPITNRKTALVLEVTEKRDGPEPPQTSSPRDSGQVISSAVV